MPRLTLVRELPTSRPRQVWDRQTTDTDKSWQAFTVYRDLGPDRTYAEVSRRLKGKDPKWIQQWADRHEWRSRTAAFDTDADQQDQQRTMAKRWKVAQHDAQIADAFLTRVLRRLQTVDVDSLDMSDLVAMTRLAVGIHRDVYFPRTDTGVSTNIVAQIVIDPTLIPPPTVVDRPTATVINAEVL